MVRVMAVALSLLLATHMDMDTENRCILLSLVIQYVFIALVHFWYYIQNLMINN